jgi:hypothetical protein
MDGNTAVEVYQNQYQESLKGRRQAGRSLFPPAALSISQNLIPRNFEHVLATSLVIISLPNGMPLGRQKNEPAAKKGPPA